MTALAQSEGRVGPSGEVGLRVVRGGVVLPPSESWVRGMVDADDILDLGFPDKSLDNETNSWRKSNRAQMNEAYRRLKDTNWAKKKGLPVFFSSLFLRVIRGDGSILPLGLASCRLVTTAGVGFIVDAFQNIVELEIMKFHAIGTGTNAEATGDTALQTELTTQYNPDNTRATGTTTENGANIYRTVGTNTVDASAAITEHGILSQAAVAGGVLLDRSVFSAVNLANGDSLESTYDLTLTAGG